MRFIFSRVFPAVAVAGFTARAQDRKMRFVYFSRV
jgi:hypothetical protein